jgi:hypothetical protein
MAQRVVTISDLSGQDVPDEDRVSIHVLEFPELSQPVKLDASKTEADRLQVESTSLALIELVMPDGDTVRLALPADQFRQAIRGDADEVLARAEGLSFPGTQPEAEASKRRGRRPRGEGAAARGDKVDYTSPEHAGVMHRGRVTEAEAEWVRNNLDEANANRRRAGQPEIDPNDEKEKKRYGF